LNVYPARQTLGRIGEQHRGYNDFEENLGLSRTYRIELADREHTERTVMALRELSGVETAVAQRLFFAPLAAAAPRRLSKDDAWEPHRRIGIPEAQALEAGDERVTVGVVDTGVALGHPEMQRRLLAGYDTVDLGMGQANGDVQLIGDSRGHDFNPLDEVNHGSHVAGIIGAQGWRIPPGVAGRCLLLPIRVLAAARSGNRPKPVGIGGLSDINVGLKCCVDLGAKIINMSFGTPATSMQPGDPLPHARMMRYADRYGCVLVAAAGNSGKAEQYYPAALPEVIAVGSVSPANERSRFSTYGPQICVCAPGENIVSIGRRGYLASTGTSHAAPFVAGIAALLVSRARRAGRDLGGADVRRLLVATANTLGGGFNHETGHGMVNAPAALRLLEQELAGAQPPGTAER
jgi:subtilisin family serine protease